METKTSKDTYVEEAKRKASALEPYIGKILLVNLHLTTHLSPYTEMMYGGQAKPGDIYSPVDFIVSKREGINGKIEFIGIDSFSNHINIHKLADRKITVCNTDLTIPNKEIRLPTEKRLEELIKLWENRKR